MEDFLLVVVLVVLFIRWLVLSSRMSEMKRRIDVLEAVLQSAGHPLPPPYPQPYAQPQPERQMAPQQEMPAAPQVSPQAPPVAVPWQAPAPPPLPSYAVASAAAAAPAASPFTPSPIPPSMPTPADAMEPEPAMVAAEAVEPIEAPPPGPTLAERLRKKMGDQEWEALVGGNLLLKLGVLTIVIGIALFLGYAFTQMGPAGRVAISLGVSAALLGGGIAIERRPLYRLIGRGLLAGGWAALYFTAYAMYAVPSAKVIASPITGAVLLFTVATGMIAHSLKYRSQTVTGLAYFVAFASLAITPVTAFSVVALVPLAASLLYIAQRFQWSEIAVFGLLATYGTCASRGDSGAAVWQAQVLFSVYWILFEAFDLLRSARHSNRAPERVIMPLNALAFGVLSYFKWSKSAPDHMYALAAGVAAAYLLSAVLRTRLRPPSSFAAEQDTMDRALAGGYEGPITITAALSAAAVLLKFHGGLANAGLLAEAEIFFLAGLFFSEAYPRRLAAALFATFAGKLAISDLSNQTRTTVIGLHVHHWTPSAVAAAVLFYLNRALRPIGKSYGYAASAVVAVIIGFETPERFMGAAMLGYAAALFIFGWARRLFDFRIQGYAMAALGLAAVGIYQADVASGQVRAGNYLWLSLACAAALAYAAALTALRSDADRFVEEERSAVRIATSWATTAAMVALLWRVTPGAYLGIAWLALAIPALELGLRNFPSDFRQQSYAVAALGALRVLIFNVIPVHNDGPLAERVGIAAAALLAYFIAARIYVARRDIPEVRIAVDLASVAGTGFLATALWALLPTVAVGPAWAALALIILEAGFAIDFPRVRLQAHALAAAAFGRVMLANFDVIGTTAAISHRLLTVVPVIASQYYAWSRRDSTTGRENNLLRLYPWAAAVLMVALLRFELGRSFTAAGWALFALALIALGERWKNVDLRWQSLIIAGMSFARAWTTDFWSPGAFAGTGTRIAAGAVVVASLFTAQLLIKRHERARLYFSLLASILLAIILFHEVSGQLLTMAWGAEGIALLIAGFPLSDRTLRLSGLSIFLVCILKLFVYDLRQLETLYRILSFIVLGLILVSVSWVYTRFRDRLQRYL